MILENFWQTMVLILLGNFARSVSVKFEVFEIISLKIGLLSFAMKHDTRELFCRLARDCNYRDEKLRAMFISKADCIAWDKILFSKLLYVSEVFWNFTCIFKLKLLFPQSRLMKSRGWNIKRRCKSYHKSSNSSQEVKLQVKFSAEKNILKL